MKNIHLLPTDKTSRLFKITRVFVFDVNGIKYTERYKQLHKYINQNIYITSDEEIKQRDWYIDTSVFKENIAINRGIYQMKCFKWGIEGQRDCKKIILTTDQDLIADGVQAIDDEFLEWFVKNPSCERVYVEKEKINLGYVSGTTYVDFNYKIIIPKEEPKQVCIDWSSFPKSTQEKVGYEEPKLFKDMLPLTKVQWEKFKKNPIPNKKEETLEEVAENFYVESYEKERSELSASKAE